MGVVLPARLRKPQVIIDPDFTVFHDAELALTLFMQLQTQWTIGMAGAIGLNYAGVIPVIALYEKTGTGQRELLGEIQALESGCLQGWADNRDMDAKENPEGFNKSAIEARRQARC